MMRAVACMMGTGACMIGIDPCMLGTSVCMMGTGAFMVVILGTGTCRLPYQYHPQQFNP